MSESVQHDEQGSSLHAEGLTTVLRRSPIEYISWTIKHLIPLMHGVTRKILPRKVQYLVNNDVCRISFISFRPLASQGRTCFVELVYYSNSIWTLPVQF